MKGITSIGWADFLEKIKEAKQQIDNDGPIWFRGHNNAGYYLLPSLLRYTNGLDKEKYLFNSFRKFSDRIFVRHNSEWETLFDMQHYGVPTRLLDWSETFGIALFFAACDNLSCYDAAIYILNPLKLNQVSRISKIYTIPREEGEYSYSNIYWNKTPFAPSAPIAIEPIFINSRMSAQRGVFTVHDDSIDPIEYKYPEAIRKVILPKELIHAALEFLDLANLNEFSVYPDLGGISRFLINSSGLEPRWR
jgi:hypothetical protein